MMFANSDKMAYIESAGRCLDPWLNCSRHAYVRYHCGICLNWRYLCNTCTWQSSPGVVSPWYNYPYQEGDSYWHSRREHGRITPEIGLRIKKTKNKHSSGESLLEKNMMTQNRHLWYFVLNVEPVVPFIWWPGRKTERRSLPGVDVAVIAELCWVGTLGGVLLVPRNFLRNKNGPSWVRYPLEWIGHGWMVVHDMC